MAQLIVHYIATESRNANYILKGLDRLDIVPFGQLYNRDVRRKLILVIVNLDLQFQESAMKYLTSSLIALAFAATAAQAQAQDSAPPPPDQNAAQPDAAAPPATSGPEAAPPAAATPDSAATAPATSTVSDTEVDSFAKATVELQKINTDTKLDETAKQGKMADAVKSAGLEPARYNEIGKAVATDTELRAKVQTAMAKYAGPSKG